MENAHRRKESLAVQKACLAGRKARLSHRNNFVVVKFGSVNQVKFVRGFVAKREVF